MLGGAESGEMKQIPEGTRITLRYNFQGQLCAAWHFEHKDINFGQIHVGITESLDNVLKEIEECYRVARDNYGEN